MNPDNFFRQMELRTERELYRRSFKAAAQSQDAMFEKFQNNKKEAMKRAVAREVKWFFITLLLAPILAFGFYYLFAQIIPNTIIDLAIYMEGVETVFLLLAIFCFISIYLARIVIWAVKRS